MYFKSFDQVIWTGQPEIFLPHSIFAIFANSKVSVTNDFESKTCMVKPEEVFYGYSEVFDPTIFRHLPLLFGYFCKTLLESSLPCQPQSSYIRWCWRRIYQCTDSFELCTYLMKHRAPLIPHCISTPNTRLQNISETGAELPLEELHTAKMKRSSNSSAFALLHFSIAILSLDVF